MIPTPEPVRDIRAQIAAVLDPAHPKRACFLVPENVEQVHCDWIRKRATLKARAEGALVSRERRLLLGFLAAPSDQDGFDRVMAEILGYPEAKPDVVAACEGRPFARARVVQARDRDGSVITEACCSPGWLQVTQDALRAHVTRGGTLVTLTPLEVLGRRILLREAGE
jgi:hypothetical protein